MASVISSSYRFLGNDHHTTEMLMRPDPRIFTWLEPVDHDLVRLDGKTFFLDSGFDVFLSLTASEKLLSSLSRFIFSLFCLFFWKERKNDANTLVARFPDDDDDDEEEVF